LGTYIFWHVPIFGKTTAYLYEDGKIVLEEDGNGAETARNVYGIYLLSRETGDGDYAYRFNGHGDVIALTDSAGTVVASYYYDPFGEPFGDVHFLARTSTISQKGQFVWTVLFL